MIIFLKKKKKENDVERKCGRYHPVPMVEFDEEKQLKD